MTIKKSFLFVIQLVFLLFSLQFLKDAFYKWDGFSYYLKFKDFLPDLALAYVLWTVIAAIVAIIIWLIMCLFLRAVRTLFDSFSIEYVLVLFLSLTGLVVVKRIFMDVSLRNIIENNVFVTIVVGLVFVATVIWLINKVGSRHINRALSGLASRITPIVGLFVIIFFAALLYSVIMIGFRQGTERVPWLEDTARWVDEKNYPNIIMVVMDTLTARNMSLYGYHRQTTPFISSWSNDAVVFNQFHSSANWTSPAVMSLMTGQRPWTHGIWYAANHYAVRQYKFNFPRILKENGYDVYAFVQNRYAHPETLGITDAFAKRDNYHTYWLSSGWWFDDIAKLFVNRNIVMEWVFENNVFAEIINSFRPPKYSTIVPSEEVYDQFVKYIAEREQYDTSETAQRPFFAWLHVYPPHDPYLPPELYLGKFGDEDRLLTDKDQKNSGILETEYKLELQPQVDILRKRYDEFVLYSDQEFEKFIKRLNKSVDLSNTIVILVSDHGESFNNGYQGHSGDHLYESLIHVPLIIKLPEKTISKKGVIGSSIIDMLVEQIDLAPTVLDLLEMEIPEWMEGRSVLPLMQGRTLEPVPVFSMQFIKNRALGEPITKGTIAVFDGHYKLVHYLEEDRSMLFNFKDDFNEVNNLLYIEPEIVERLKGMVIEKLNIVNERIVKKDEYKNIN